MKTFSVSVGVAFIFLCSIINSAYSQTVVQKIGDVSVGIRAGQAEGTGVVFNRTLKDGKQVTLCLSAAHVVSGLQKTYNKDVTFDDAKLIKQIVDNGRKVGEILLNASIKKYSDPDKEHDLVLLLVRKSDYFNVSTEFYLGEEIPETGRELFHVGNMLGTELGLNSVTRGLISANGRLIDDKVFDQYSGGSTGGSSGGGLFLADTGQYVGQLQRGITNVAVMGYYAPIRRMRDWAKQEKLMWVFDQTASDLPTWEEFDKMEILSERMQEKHSMSHSPIPINTKSNERVEFIPFIQ